MQIDSSFVAGTTQVTTNPAAGASGNQTATGGAAANAADPASAGGSTAAAGKAGKASQAGGGETVGGASASGEDPGVKVMKDLIERLQRQLAELQKQIEQVSQRAKNDPAAQAELQALNAQAGQLSGALQTAITKMAELMRSKSGSASGGLISTQA